MDLKSPLFLAVVLLPSLLALEVLFDTGGFAKYELLEVAGGKPLYGTQAFVLFAKVVSSPPGSEFQQGADVALKIGFAKNEVELRREQKAHNFIRESRIGDKNGVVRAEKWLGRCEGLHDKIYLALPHEELKRDKHVVLIMERLNLNLLAMFNLKREIHPDQQERLYDQFCFIMGQLKDIGLVHGDIKPENILFISDDLNGGIKLTDFGLAVFEDSGMVGCGGDLFYSSPIQFLLYRPATHDDCDVSGAFLFTYLALRTLSWIDYIQDSKMDANDQMYDLHSERINLAKYELILEPSATFRNQIKESFEKKITDTIKRATVNEVAKIQPKVDGYKIEIAKSVKNGPVLVG